MAAAYDYVVVGSGIAGLYAALLAAERGTVLVLTKGAIDDTNTRWAQGGIAAPVGPGDSPELHLRDTIAAGAGLVDEAAARVMVEEAAEAVQDLVRLGVPFDTVEGEVALAREGGHSLPRVLHAGGDATGAHVEAALAASVRAARIPVREHCLATRIVVDEGRAVGIETLHWPTGEKVSYACRFLVLATGGAGRMFRYTTNPPVATGDGIALAYRAGAEIMDMEFVQFHPTALRRPGAPPFLITEAVRGEGAVLLNPRGERFMPRYHPQAELAPRDVVVRAMVAEMRAVGSDHVLLDMSHLPRERVAARFPQVYRTCLELGLDIAREPVPVSPAAHYTIGGIRTDLWGQTTLPGLYACGECACTGVHGANRLASNSLLESVVFARQLVRRTAEAPAGHAPLSPAAVELPPPDPAEAPAPTLEALQSLMWEDVGIVRDGAGLTRAAALLRAWQAALPPPSDRQSHELANLLTCARLTTEAALLREESRGVHYRLDHPQPREEWRRHIVFRRCREERRR
ncbi:MAG: L-aspartate oxidase [Dehalococcoidia bacterium]|nr:L-aspartate oxidase [Dehalococcoidia bacterium]MDW8009064.1 L-aspartate oxidase [Chloroflexota bacterium]